MGLAAVVHEQVLDPLAEQRRQSLFERDHVAGVCDVRPGRRAFRELPAAVPGGWPETLEDKIVDAERAPQSDEAYIPVGMGAGRFESLAWDVGVEDVSGDGVAWQCRRVEQILPLGTYQRGLCFVQPACRHKLLSHSRKTIAMSLQ